MQQPEHLDRATPVRLSGIDLLWGSLWLTGVLLVSACVTGGEGEQHSQPSPSQRDLVIERFTNTPARPFLTIERYLQWIASRPGSLAYAVDAQPLKADRWSVVVAVKSAQNEEAIAVCQVREGTGFDTGAPWYDCPDLASLWTKFTPPTFGSVAEVRPFLPPALPWFFPKSIPAGYDVERIELSPTDGDGTALPFVVKVTFAANDGSRVVLIEQPAGLLGAVFPEYSQCVIERSGPPVHCLAWTGMAMYFTVLSEGASEEVLRAFQQSVQP